MGYRLSTYTRESLSNVAIPGVAAPSLFWLMPVGTWPQDELRNLDRLFYEDDGPCKDLGLLLVRDMFGRQRAEGGVTDLSSLSSSLADVLPVSRLEGRAISMSGTASRRQVLVMGGAYPQPGWGMLLSLGKDPCREINQLIAKVLAAMTSDQTQPLIDSIKQATRAFHAWKDAGSMSGFITRAIPGSAKEKLIAAATTYRKLSEILAKGDVKELKEFRQKLIRDGTPELPTGLLDEAGLHELILAKGLGRLATDVVAMRLVPTLKELVELPKDERPDKLGVLGPYGCRQEGRSWLILNDFGKAPPLADLLAWRESAQRNVVDRHQVEIETLIKKSSDALGQCVAEEVEQAECLKKSLESKSRAVGQAQKTFQTALKEAAVAQWDIGPRFLTELEAVCRQGNTDFTTIPWDPPRMIGWKLFAQGLNIRLGDLTASARKFLGKTDIEQAVAAGDISSPVDGSYFTDWVHYVVSQDPTRNVREVTEHYLVDLLGLVSLRRAVERSGGSTELLSDQFLLARQLLDLMGWRSSSPPARRTLANVTLNSGTDTDVSANDLRKILENFCKDLIDVLVMDVAGGVGRTVQLLQSAVPAYRFSKRTWDAEVASITLGPAAMLLKTLAPIAAPTRQEAAANLSGLVAELAKLLNQGSHDIANGEVDPYDVTTACALCRELIQAASELITEMPWHLSPSHRSGENPTVISGMAWSHSHPQPRLIRVMLFGDETVGDSSSMFIRNLSGRNPVMTDVMTIHRPIEPLPKVTTSD